MPGRQLDNPWSRYLTLWYPIRQVPVRLVFRQTVTDVNSCSAVSQPSPVARPWEGVWLLYVCAISFHWPTTFTEFFKERRARGSLPLVRNMDELIESKNALWRRENQLRCWDTSETNSASSTPRDRQLSAVKFHDACVFLAACASGDTKEVTWLLGRGADINTANVDGLTALHQVSYLPGNLPGAITPGNVPVWNDDEYAETTEKLTGHCVKVGLV